MGHELYSTFQIKKALQSQGFFISLFLFLSMRLPPGDWLYWRTKVGKTFAITHHHNYVLIQQIVSFS
jgi:hypothetical protein